MVVLLVVTAVWSLLALLAVSLCRAAAAGEREPVFVAAPLPQQAPDMVATVASVPPAVARPAPGSPLPR